MASASAAGCGQPLLRQRTVRPAQPRHVEADGPRTHRLAAHGVAGGAGPGWCLRLGARLGIAGTACFFPDLADALCAPRLDLSIPPCENQQPNADAAHVDGASIQPH